MGQSLDMALGRRARNRTFNPNFALDQRNAGAAQTPGVGITYIADQHYAQLSQAGKLTFQRNAVALAANQPTAYAEKITVAAAVAAPAAGDYFHVCQPYEGWYMDDLLWGSAFARQMVYTIGIYSPVTGPHSIAVRNGDGTRSYVTTVNVQQANTVEYHTLLIPGDTTGVWPIGEGQLHTLISLTLAAGANYTTANLNQWQAGNYLHAAGAVNLLATAGQVAYIVWEQYERDYPTPVDPIDPERNLVDCLRYYEAGRFFFVAHNCVGNIGSTVFFKGRKSKTPTITQTSTSNSNCEAITRQTDQCPDSFLSYRQGAVAPAAQYSESWIATAALI